jgi:hypothetical protein
VRRRGRKERKRQKRPLSPAPPATCEIFAGEHGTFVEEDILALGEDLHVVGDGLFDKFLWVPR